MQEDDKKFFEELARHDSPVPTEESQNVKVELAKAESAIVSKPKVTKRSAVVQEDFEDETEGQLTIDVYQNADDIVVESAVAGVEPEDIDINVTGDSITIKGRRHRKTEVKEDDYFYQECYWGKFSRSVILPQEIDPEKAVATFRNGILTVRLPKVSRQRSKKLKVKLE